MSFQSTHPHGVRLPETCLCLFRVMFQSTHPHGVRHHTANIQTNFRTVSIHAPTRGATLRLILAILSRSVFQSTHPHGVRQIELYTLKILLSFNPRTHTGCDESWLGPCVSFSQVSIHAPTRGATTVQTYTNRFLEFQSTHPHGVRRKKIMSGKDTIKFQSTHPHGVRPNRRLVLCTDHVFQSTHPHGVRPF